MDMKNILLVISLLILISSCSIWNNSKKEDPLKTDTKVEETKNEENMDTEMNNEEEALKEIENKEVIDTTNWGNTTNTEEVSATNTEEEATEEEIVKEFENELDDLFKSLEWYE